MVDGSMLIYMWAARLGGERASVVMWLTEERGKGESRTRPRAANASGFRHRCSRHSKLVDGFLSTVSPLQVMRLVAMLC